MNKLEILKNKLDKIEIYKDIRNFITWYPNDLTRIIIKQYRQYGIFARKLEIEDKIFIDILDELIEREEKIVNEYLGGNE